MSINVIQKIKRYAKILLLILFLEACNTSPLLTSGQIAYACEQDNKIFICLINADGTGRRVLIGNYTAKGETKLGR